MATTTPTASPSPSDANTATLYLFTFLATILILLFLSASLVLRSYVLRRRYRQRFQRALSDGLFTDPDRAVSARSALNTFRRPPPVLWDTWIHSADKLDSLSSFTPVAVRCSPPTSSQQSLGSPSSRSSIFSPLRLPSPFSLSRCTSPTRSPARSPPGFPIHASPSLAPPTSPDTTPSAEYEATSLQVCVLIAMPAVSAPAHRTPPDAKGKGMDPLDFQARQYAGDADPLLPSSLPRSGIHISDVAFDEEGLPSLEFGILEVKTGNWVWSISTS